MPESITLSPTAPYHTVDIPVAPDPRLCSQIPHALPGPVQSRQKHVCNAALASSMKASMLFYLKRLCHIETTMTNYDPCSYSGGLNRHSLQGQNSVVSPGFLPSTHTGDSPSNPSHVYHSQASTKGQHSVHSKLSGSS